MAAESESLRDVVVRSRHLPRDAALESILAMPKVQAWVGEDFTRRRRIESEFDRLWQEIAHGGGVPSPVRIQAAATVTVPRAPVRARHEKFLCSSCGGFDIFSESDGESVRVRCRQCKAEFPDLLALVPVVEVGPFELFFGRGREAWIKGGALVGLWAAVYLLLKILA